MDGGTSIILTAQRGRAGDGKPGLVKLSGEFDIRYQRTLENILSYCLVSGRPMLVDLSEVTFMDSLCVRELAVHYRLSEGSMALCDPSRQAELSVAACDLEEWIDFVYTASDDHQARPPRWETLSARE